MKHMTELHSNFIINPVIIVLLLFTNTHKN